MTAQAPLLDAFRLDDAVAVVTGGARGIGFETAKLFAAVGAKVVILDWDQASLDRASAELGPWCTAIRADVTVESDVGAAFEQVMLAHGRVDVCVNNAGTAIRRPTVELSLKDWQTVVDVNMTGVFLTARAAARQMIAQRSGRIVNLASIFGLSGGGLYPNISYQATKGAVVNMTKAFAMEWATSGIRVNAVAPTWCDTEFIAALKEQPKLIAQIEKLTPMRRMVTPLEVAYAILYLASPASAMVTGHVLAVDGGFLAQ
jgi:NAD(P)-dependent dehydrogenase (short-subunit alcohol dehydrogenase family)